MKDENSTQSPATAQLAVVCERYGIGRTKAFQLAKMVFWKPFPCAEKGTSISARSKLCRNEWRKSKKTNEFNRSPAVISTPPTGCCGAPSQSGDEMNANIATIQDTTGVSIIGTLASHYGMDRQAFIATMKKDRDGR